MQILIFYDSKRIFFIFISIKKDFSYFFILIKNRNKHSNLNFIETKFRRKKIVKFRAAISSGETCCIDTFIQQSVATLNEKSKCKTSPNKVSCQKLASNIDFDFFIWFNVIDGLATFRTFFKVL